MKITQSWTSGYRGNLLTLIAGCIFPLGFAPIHWWPLTVLSVALFIPLLEGQTAARAALRSWLYGFGFYAVGVSWVYISINTYGYTPQWLSIILTGLFAAGLALFFALFGWSYQKLKLESLYWLSFPCWWIIFEWVKAWFLSGFPWLYVGNAFIDTPMRGLAPVTGVLGISWAVVFSAALLVLTFRRPAKQKLALLGIALIWGGAYWLQQHTWVTPSIEKPLNIALVQGNIPQEKKWDPKERDNIINTYMRHTEPNWNQDVIIWPEAALPVFYQEAGELTTRLILKAQDTDTALITGSPYWKNDGGEYRYYNSILSIGKGNGVYHKQRLVPFGEYVPLESYIRGLIPFFDMPLSSFSRGSSDQKLLVANNASFAPFICYEIVYPELVRNQGKDADYLITVSNDAWFGSSWGPHQHFQIVRMRALEMGKYLIRGTNTGITAIIDYKGKVVSRLPQFNEGVLKGSIYTTIGNTPYQNFGWWPVMIASFIVTICVFTLGLKRSREH
ncbi:MAG: apolipoprotein N-acyltransferase [Pseudomonadales bacterium]|nr:apolipoprotein N-acyltransferase [Pseudomonadales bacterium]